MSLTPQEKILLDGLDQRINFIIDMLGRLNYPDRFYLQKPLVLRNTVIRIEGTDGLKIGEHGTDKLSFYGTTPVVQAAAVTAPTGGATIDTQARTAINSIITLLHNAGLTA